MENERICPVLLIGLEERTLPVVESHLAGAEITRVGLVEEFEAGRQDWEDGMFAAIFCGPRLKGFPGPELAQILTHQCPATPKYFVTLDNTTFEASSLVKRGFNEVFLLPIDQLVLKKAIDERVSTGLAKRAMRAVRIFDIQPGAVLDFDTYVFLPLNRKYVKYTVANKPIEAERLDRLTHHQVNAVFIEQKDMVKFYRYAGSRLRVLGDGAISSTERHERLKQAVRGIFADIFDASLTEDSNEGKAMMETCAKIISNYITNGASNHWYERLTSAIGELGDTYDHATRVSTFAALFAIGLGHQRAEDLAMAGLFHDLGMSTLPDVIALKAESDMTLGEKILYFMHPGKSVSLVKGKKLALTEEVENAILQHHEKFSGDGYPNQLPADRITRDAQILAFADQFDEFTQTVEGRPRLTPLEAWDVISVNGSVGLDLMAELKLLLQKEPPRVANEATDDAAEGVSGDTSDGEAEGKPV